jgi:hypothetical protein
MSSFVGFEMIASSSALICFADFMAVQLSHHGVAADASSARSS